MGIRSSLSLSFVWFVFAISACSPSTREPAPPPSPEEPAPPPTPEEPAPPPTPPAEPPGGATSSPPNLVVGSDPCKTDADCLPAACCHASACVGTQNAPDCKGMMCTQECKGGTIDCGGGCLCHEGHCAAKIVAATVQ